MPTIHVTFRRDGHRDGRLVPAYSEDLDLDQLTPRARALAEALHLSMQPNSNMTFPCDVLCECDATNAELAGRPPARPAEYGPVTDPDTKAQRVVHYQFPKATDRRSTSEWLEEQARDMPLDWYPIGVRHQPRVPSWEAGRDDRYLTRGQVLDYLRVHGAEMSVQGWDTLIGTGHLPAPDRYACGKPQWLPATIDAYITRPFEVWNLNRAAEHMGVKPETAYKTLWRLGIPVLGREAGRGGQSQYADDQVKAAHAHRPGRGARTDLTRDTRPAH